MTWRGGVCEGRIKSIVGEVFRFKCLYFCVTVSCESGDLQSRSLALVEPFTGVLD